MKRVLAVLMALACATATPAQEPATTQPVDTQPATTQATATQPTTQPGLVVETAATDISLSVVQTRIAQIESDSSTPQDVKNEALILLKQALEQLSLADTWSAKTAEFREGIKNAPADLETAKQRLAVQTTRPATAVAPDVSADTSLDELVDRQAAAEAHLAALQQEDRRLGDIARQRGERRSAIPNLLTEASKRLEALKQNLTAPVSPGTHPRVAEARRARMLAQKRAVEEELKTYQTELQFFEVRSEVLAKRREESKLAVAEAKAQIEPLRQLADQRRQAEAELKTRRAREELGTAPEAVRELARDNAQLAEEQAELARRIADAGEKSLEASHINEQIEKDLSYLKENASRPGMTTLISPWMRKKRSELQDFRFYASTLRATTQEFSRALFRLSEIEEERLVMSDLESEVTGRVDEVLAALPAVEKGEIEPRIRELLEARRDLLIVLKRDYDDYSAALMSLTKVQSTLSTNIAAMSDFIDAHVLWIKSLPPIYRVHLPENLSRVPRAMVSMLVAVFHDILANIGIYAVALLVLGILVAARPWIQNEVAAAGDKVARVASDSFLMTLLALVGTAVLAGLWPGLLLFLFWRIDSAVQNSSSDVYDAGTAIAAGLRSAAAVWFTLSLFVQICMPKGVADRHFRWDDKVLQKLRANFAWLQLPAVILVFAVMAPHAYAVAAYRGALGRLAYLALLAVIAVFAKRLLHPVEGIIAMLYRRNTGHWIFRARYLWYGGTFALLLVLACLSAVGFHYTAIELTRELCITIWLGFTILFLYGLLARWVFFLQRRMVLEEARKKRAALAAKPDTSETEMPPPEEATIDVIHVSGQTLRLLRSAALFALVIGLWMIWSNMLPAIRFLGDIQLWEYKETVASNVGGAEASGVVTRHAAITLSHMLLALVATLVTVILAKNIPGLLEIMVLRHFQLDVGTRFAITAITRYLITVIGILVAFNMIGVGWSKVQWLVAAITVGLGFGLQEIFANFVSGLMLLFERPIRVGDTVSVGEVSGTVSRIQIRATTITAWDRKELVIPNKEFITGRFINWTLSDSILRVTVPVGIAYGSDIDLAMSILRRIADEQPTVVAEPEPRVLFIGFGDSTLNFELRVYVARIDDYLKTTSEINCAIDREFRKAGVEIAFPQRDIHVRSIRATLPLHYQSAPPLDDLKKLQNENGDEK